MRELRNLDGLRLRDLTQRQRLLLLYVAGLALVVLFYTVVYNAGMRVLEGRPQPIFRSLQTVTETMTTTGYGADSPWATPAMNLLVAAMQLTGVIIGFVTLRVLVIPLFERAPLNLDDRLSSKDDHVVIAEYARDTRDRGQKTRAAFRAGADYVLSVQRVRACLVAAEVHGERVMDPVSQIRSSGPAPRPSPASRWPPPGARPVPAGRWSASPASGTVYTGGDLGIEAGDEVFVAGSDRAIQEFERTVDAS